jgi:predicted GTPase
MGAAGRDFHNFNMVFRDDPTTHVLAFTAAQIPGIDNRTYPPELAGPLYPDGIPVVPEDELDRLLVEKLEQEVVFAYSDVSHEFVMHQACRVMAAGADFSLLGPESTMVPSTVPVIAVLAVRTGAGKSPISRLIAQYLVDHGVRPAVVRHPMPYGDLAKQRVQRFASFADLDRQHATIEEREDYEPHLRKGLTVWAGVDYEAIVAEAQREAGVIVWDGGNNDFSFIRPDLEVVVADPLRPSHELRYYPGELNVRRADVVVINKVNNAPEEDVRQVVENVRSLNPAAVVVKTDSRIGVDDPEAIRGRRVLVVEDGPTLTHGGMATGAGFEAARRYGASEIIDPRPYARGLMAGTYDKYPHLGPILPALGYYSDQLHDLEQTINEVPADVVVSGTPFSLESLVRIVRPVVRVSYEAVETGEPRLSEVLQTFLGRHGLLP